jgi:hypothetical protein
LGPKTVDCVFLGYAHNSAAYRFLVIKSKFPDVHVNTLTESRDATFFEEIFPMKDRVATPSEASTSSVPQPIPFSLPPVHSEQPIEDYSMMLLEGARDKELKNPLVMILLFILWMIHQKHFQRHMHHQM